MRSLYQIGQGEWDSEAYLGQGLTTYVNLYDFAKDSEVRAIAKSALDWFTVTGALKYWPGGFGGPSKRDYSEGNCVWCSGAAQALGLYFGDSPVQDTNQNPDLVHLITSSYRPPAVAVALARKQFTKPLELLNSKPQYENSLPGRNSQPQFYETLYFGHSFQLGTLAQGSGGDWNGFKLMSYNSHRGIDYFIAATGTDPTKISTSSVGNNAVAQYQNLAIWLNDKPAPFQFFLPKSAQIELQAGKMFVKVEKTWLAIAPINLQLGAINSNLNHYPDEHILAAIGTGQGVSGFTLEVGERESYSSWEDFKRPVLINFKLKINNSDAYGGKLRQAEYFSSKKKVKLQHQGRELPKVWRDGRYHDWRTHYDVYRSEPAQSCCLNKEGLANPEGDTSNMNKARNALCGSIPVDTFAPIYQAWKGGKLEVIANGNILKGAMRFCQVGEKRCDALLGLSQQYLSFTNRILQYTTLAAYPVFLLYQTVLVAISFYVVQWNLDIAAKFLIISTATVLITNIFYEILIKRLNIVRFLFGLKHININK